MKKPVRPTSCSPRPSSHTSSVREGTRQTMRASPGHRRWRVPAASVMVAGAPWRAFCCESVMATFIAAIVGSASFCRWDPELLPPSTVLNCIQREESIMRIGVPREIKTHEYRVGLTPSSVREVVAHGHEVVVEHNAGQGIGVDDAAYQTAGARIVASAE